MAAKTRRDGRASKLTKMKADKLVCHLMSLKTCGAFTNTRNETMLMVTCMIVIEIFEGEVGLEYQIWRMEACTESMNAVMSESHDRRHGKTQVDAHRFAEGSKEQKW